jgi:hypothetical protein
MRKILLTGLLGGLALFVWGMISWMALPFHTQTLRPMPNEEAIAAVLAENITESGAYMLPGYSAGMSKEAETAWFERHRNGPLVPLMIFHPDGREPMSPMVFIWGLIVDILAVLLFAVAVSGVSKTQRSFKQIMFMGSAFGVIICLVAPVTYMIWAYWPAGYALTLGLDYLAGWTAVGAIAGKLLK